MEKMKITSLNYFDPFVSCQKKSISTWRFHLAIDNQRLFCYFIQIFAKCWKSFQFIITLRILKWILARTKRKRKPKFYIKSLILILNYSLFKKKNINMKWRWGWRSFLLLYNYLKQAFWPMGLFLWNSNDKTKFTSPTDQTRRIQNGNW